MIRKKNGFTLIEMLVVIAVIAILVAMVVPLAGTVRRKGQTAQAQAEVKQIESAVKMYVTTYGKYPEQSSGSGEKSYVNTDYEDLLIILRADQDANASLVTQENPRLIPFLDAPEGFQDPWDVDYVVRVDQDFDPSNNGEVLDNRSIAVWSFGPDRQAYYETDGGTDDTAQQDDVTSWGG